MPVNDSPLTLNAEQLIRQVPGVVFQFHRTHNGHMAFPFMEGAGLTVAPIDRDQLAQDANTALEQLTGTDYPKLMSAIERSARWMLPLTTRFRLALPGHKSPWMAVSATPEPIPSGVRWHGIMMDISDQVSEEQRLRKLCDTDPLTSLPNRRKLMVHLTNLASLSSRHGTPLSIMMVDIDHFKHLNDRWGHLQGDEVLKQLASLSQSLLRSEDMIARLGGEEFMAVLPLTPVKQCHQLADRLRQHIAEYDFGIGVGQVTLSIGVAEYRCGEPLTSLIERADQALYSAKDVGRDCVCLLP
ncbi:MULTISPECIES: GGDEF domain-containing protein [unclassified Halomonas]|uniref:GGDEF domain-containing protein n=1 Tax=unclassified Halomonas TaxID=2609666 RepID=UPI0006DA84C9|nr:MULTISPECIES: GGDEF domain-containing protein [unclassified Halomonas]KPQ26677.1 MAG: diguanylate cyclase [Halomonas sp. HL-93]SBR48441.1 diguanylate cyclase (GGDEF) domain-containing protein [Halomonas sp. HL-93]SNY96278.1 diguanylate cyclase (GGDEF) domain-containing protein [Halomonas sp. hl-4]